MMNTNDNTVTMYDDDSLVADTDQGVPNWMDQDLEWNQVAAIIEGGCASGAYMPAVTYYQALKTMSEYGDDVLQYIEDVTGEVPCLSDNLSWGGMACFYLSIAVELWAADAETMWDQIQEEKEEEGDDSE